MLGPRAPGRSLSSLFLLGTEIATDCVEPQKEKSKIMDLVPLSLMAFKVIVLVGGMLYSIKWHYDKDKSSQPVNVSRLILEFSLYAAAMVAVLASMYFIFHYLHFLPVGTDFI